MNKRNSPQSRLVHLVVAAMAAGLPTTAWSLSAANSEVCRDGVSAMLRLDFAYSGSASADARNDNSKEASPGAKGVAASEDVGDASSAKIGAELELALEIEGKVDYSRDCRRMCDRLEDAREALLKAQAKESAGALSASKRHARRARRLFADALQHRFAVGIAKPDDCTKAKPRAKAQAKPETKPQAKPETKPQAKPETKPQAKPETKPQAKPETKPQAKPETKGGG